MNGLWWPETETATQTVRYCQRCVARVARPLLHGQFYGCVVLALWCAWSSC